MHRLEAFFYCIYDGGLFGLDWYGRSVDISWGVRVLRFHMGFFLT
jgi:hypothetical protein